MEESNHKQSSESKDGKTSMVEQVCVTRLDTFSFVFENSISSFENGRTASNQLNQLLVVHGIIKLSRIFKSTSLASYSKNVIVPLYETNAHHFS